MTQTHTHTVTLLPDDLRVIHDEAARRDARHADSRNWSIDRKETHIRGLKGEIGFANQYDLDPDLSARPDGDGGVDFRVNWITDDATVDVKTTTFTDPVLLVREASKLRADHYVLVQLAHGIDVHLIGWADRETVANAPVTDMTGHTTNYILKPDELRALPDSALITAQDKSDTPMPHRKPPADIFALRTRDTSDEYAEARIMNTKRAEYLDAILDKEVARDTPRQQRIAWINQRRRQLQSNE